MVHLGTQALQLRIFLTGFVIEEARRKELSLTTSSL